MDNSNLRSALIVEVPEAEPLVGKWRSDLDASAAVGIPAHITVIAPFMPSAQIDSEVLDELTGLFACEHVFRYNLIRTSWFGESVLWLAPDRPERFKALIARVCAAFAEYPSYGGQFGEPTPHLTIGQGGPSTQMNAAESALQSGLPVSAIAKSVTLFAELDTGGWERVTSFSFNTPPSEHRD